MYSFKLHSVVPLKRIPETLNKVDSFKSDRMNCFKKRTHILSRIFKKTTKKTLNQIDSFKLKELSNP